MPRPWILLRGLAREAGHWGEFADVLAQAMHPQPVVAIDLPGNGIHWREPSPTRVQAMVESVRQQLALQGLAPPYDLLAMSMGAMVGVAWAQAHPGELAHAVLVNTSMRPFSPWWHRLRPSAWHLLARAMLPGANPAVREALVLTVTSNRAGAQWAQWAQARVREWVALREAHPVTRANVLRQLLAAARFRARPLAPAVPLLLLASRRDRLVSPQCSEVIARKWGSAIAVHPGAGHDLPLDDAQWVARAVRRWLD